ncbi:Protein trichome birefringence-like [Seminavis robusta]|uniref:Protein trichome birefringence-like n=1 Tax=Seminavis robusta TaxID=568900 RepID=A0A9N8HDH4_9STRA|nr:Protein trichome birefringence-like [Seminavis robusta]|eukprot:Sro428_g140790.1 Protein trichome birefringence-like (405) ;mRNA; f:8620-10082
MIDNKTSSWLRRGKRSAALTMTFLLAAAILSLRCSYSVEHKQDRELSGHDQLPLRRQAPQQNGGDMKPKTWCRTPEEYNRGQWVYNDSSDVTYPYLSGPDPVWGPICTKLQREYLDSGNQSHMLPDFLRYRWQPDDCDLDNQGWDRDQFCRRLNGKTIGVSGDSMSQQFIHSLMGFSHGTIEDHLNYVVPGKFWEGQPDHWLKIRVPLCPDDERYNVTLVYQRWDKYQGQEQDRAALTALIEESDYLVLNWGVHYQAWSDMERATDDFVGLLEKLWRSPHKKPERLMWRSTNVAHARCSSARGPLKEIKSSSNSSFTDETKSVIHEMYSTQEILWQDSYIVKPRLLSKLPQTTLLRIEETTLKRPDGHRVEGYKGQEDCLHYCEPGPVDHWTQLFYHHVVALQI